MFDWLHAFVTKFQTLIVGALGFGGVMLTLWYNARETRKQHERGIQHERELIRRAILAELRRNRDTFLHNQEVLMVMPQGCRPNVPKRIKTDIYTKHFGRLLYLNEDELKDTLEAYSRIEAILERIMHIMHERLATDEIIQNEYSVQINSEFVELYRELINNALDATNKAIATLEAGNS